MAVAEEVEAADKGSIRAAGATALVAEGTASLTSVAATADGVGGAESVAGFSPFSTLAFFLDEVAISSPSTPRLFACSVALKKDRQSKSALKL